MSCAEGDYCRNGERDLGNRQEIKAVLGEGKVQKERKKERMDYGVTMNKRTDTIVRHSSGRVPLQVPISGKSNRLCGILCAAEKSILSLPGEGSPLSLHFIKACLQPCLP